MRQPWNWAVLVAGAAVAFGVAGAEERFDTAKRDYESKCAGCHGVRGMGTGPRSAGPCSPTNIARLARHNGGVFPRERVLNAIDGRDETGQHQACDMPAWGRAYGAQAAEYFVDVPYDNEGYVRARVEALCDYVARLQVK